MKIQNSWNPVKILRLEGFVYKRFVREKILIPWWLGWLGRQPEFARQPWRQLAKILKDDGDDDGAREVLYEMEKRRRKEMKEGKAGIPNEPAWRRFLNFVHGITVGYGYHPLWIFYWIFGMTLLWTAIYWFSYCHRGMMPTDKAAYCSFKYKRQLPEHYDHFHALAYSLGYSFPLLNLEQTKLWQPDPTPDKSEPHSHNLDCICPSITWFGILNSPDMRKLYSGGYSLHSGPPPSVV